MLFEKVLDEVLPESISAIILYGAGFATSLIWMKLSRKRLDTKLTTRIQIAINAIYEAEQTIKR